MHEQGLSKLAGAIAERKAIAKKIDELQIELDEYRIDINQFYYKIVTLKENLQNGII
tara:strand:- start:54 stop:224 length:171 start_codon:yes stop_codon:yes gene_type:complete